MDLAMAINAFLALVFVLSLIGLSAWLLRRHGDGRLFRSGGGTAPKRLAVLETLMIDARRRLVLVRCDKDEYLLLAGPDETLIVKSGIANPESRKGKTGTLR